MGTIIGLKTTKIHHKKFYCTMSFIASCIVDPTWVGSLLIKKGVKVTDYILILCQLFFISYFIKLGLFLWFNQIILFGNSQ